MTPSWTVPLNEPTDAAPLAVALSVLSALWTYWIFLTGGGALQVGAWRLSSHNPRNPALLWVVSSLMAWWVYTTSTPEEKLNYWRLREALLLSVILAAFAFEILVCSAPTSSSWGIRSCSTRWPSPTRTGLCPAFEATPCRCW